MRSSRAAHQDNGSRMIVLLQKSESDSDVDQMSRVNLHMAMAYQGEGDLYSCLSLQYLRRKIKELFVLKPL